MSVVAARGVAFHTRRLGNGPPVVLLHGLLTGSIATWYFTAAPRLAERFDVTMFDLRGHGRSEITATSYGATEMALDVEALTDDLPPFGIVAHSYGCVVAARFAAAHPDRVRGLALVEPPFGLEIGDVDLAEVANAGRALPSRQQARLRTLLTETSLLDDIRREPELTDAEIAALPGDLLVVFGDRSPCRVGVEAVGRSRPDARVELLPGGHEVHLDATDALTDLLDTFLAAAAAKLVR